MLVSLLITVYKHAMKIFVLYFSFKKHITEA